MASFAALPFHLAVFLLLLAQPSAAARPLAQSSTPDSSFPFQYHDGPLLTGRVSVNLIWYGKFTPSQRAVVTDFVSSLSKSPAGQPSVATWWKATEKYYDAALKSHSSKRKASPPLVLSAGAQILVEDYSLGKSLQDRHLHELAARGGQRDAVNVVLTAPDVMVAGFCTSRCGTHGSLLSSKIAPVKGKSYKFAYIWVGNSETTCPGKCAWPFHQPIYGPQAQPLVAPNNDVGLDGIIINLASLLAGTVTNPFKNGYYQGPAEAPLEAATACTGIYGSGAYPGYAGSLLVDAATGASYNAVGVNGRKYLLPALFDPSTSSCSTLV